MESEEFFSPSILTLTIVLPSAEYVHKILGKQMMDVPMS